VRQCAEQLAAAATSGHALPLMRCPSKIPHWHWNIAKQMKALAQGPLRVDCKIAANCCGHSGIEQDARHPSWLSIACHIDGQFVDEVCVLGSIQLVHRESWEVQMSLSVTLQIWAS
jgi:hypothetical protein